ncbi:Apo-citrate lyase phosphoribosyl-dephospho-CoA transferase [Caballeronia sp. SBC1]|uniref:citrate lyase holo-[acyl-carrier protein] synthase n=1 Tax=unclassified Caballeronia TaxID=2646786 RepID=UPI0013E11766|nr:MULTISPECIES: citrate lyase holo-[acyl-carrier protein] synthase [unclassified Caballeronia]QIE25451.1 Apo-citrate lyase phosphoribosyl-dephospho-CoA transferase [Caballeronia sp. SBC2]QIN63501.1 Apo-citrate lyase phosphoribosyl-dephospho-CoA transferase [Caballeronia sp. SBC1]
MNPSINAQPVTLEAVLVAREARAQHQAQWLARHGAPLVSTTLVSPGAVKDGASWRRVMQEALSAVAATLARHQWAVNECTTLWLPTGPEALYAVRANPVDLKLAMVELEDGHRWGRLWDLDVIDEVRPLSRLSLGLEPRRCLVCDDEAHACARARRHPIEELLAAIDARINESE